MDVLLFIKNTNACAVDPAHRAYAAPPVAAQGPIGPVLQAAAAAAAAEQAQVQGAAAADARQSAHRLSAAGAACPYCALLNAAGPVHGDGECRSRLGRCLRCFARNHSSRQCQLDTAVLNRCRQCALPGWVADVQLALRYVATSARTDNTLEQERPC